MYRLRTIEGMPKPLALVLLRYRQGGNGSSFSRGSSSNDPALQNAMPVGLGIRDWPGGCISVGRPHGAEWQGGS